MTFLVLSHLRWNFVFQRPQHLLTRCAAGHEVFFWEEPVYLEGIEPRLSVNEVGPNLTVLVPELPTGIAEGDNFRRQQELLDEFLLSHVSTNDLALWYYTPMARNFTRHLLADVVVYDCMDELSAFRGAPPGLRAAEAELFEAADLVFTGGQSLYESKRTHHRSVHCFPSSIDTSHFSQARDLRLSGAAEPADQASVPHPRLGYCGVIDERMDIDLIGEIARLRPDWHLVMIGPVVKISDADLPKETNIHWLGGKKYEELPAYMAGWDIGLLPFALNESTRYISPTKTPEYLAAGLPVISTRITDVARPYGELGLVTIADTAEQFVAAAERYLSRSAENEPERLTTVDAFLARNSWQRTWNSMFNKIEDVLERKKASMARNRPADSVASAD